MASTGLPPAPPDAGIAKAQLIGSLNSLWVLVVLLLIIACGSVLWWREYESRMKSDYYDNLVRLDGKPKPPVKVPVRDVEDQDDGNRASDTDDSVEKRETGLENSREDDRESQSSGVADSKRSIKWERRNMALR